MDLYSRILELICTSVLAERRKEKSERKKKACIVNLCGRFVARWFAVCWKISGQRMSLYKLLIILYYGLPVRISQYMR